MSYTVYCYWCFLSKGSFFLIDAKFLCHVPFLSALRNQSHYLHLLALMHPITLFSVFREFSFLETLCNRESCLKTCPIQFFCLSLKLSTKERLSSTIPNMCSFDACCVEHVRQRRGDGGDASPNILAGGCNASHPPCCEKLVSIITMSHSTECGLSFFLYEW